jgi:hypothetical protein
MPPTAFSAPGPTDGGEPAASTGVAEPAAESLEVWIRGEDGEWIARVEGQLSDLSARVHPLTQPLEPYFEQQLAAGKAVRTDGLVVWLSPNSGPPEQLEPRGDGAYLYAWFANAKRLSVR